MASGASGDWSGQAGKIAARQAGNWLFAVPRDGLRLLNRATGQEMRYAAGWKAATRPAAPSGGAVVGSEALSSIAAIISALSIASIAGIVPASWPDLYQMTVVFVAERSFQRMKQQICADSTESSDNIVTVGSFCRLAGTFATR